MLAIWTLAAFRPMRCAPAAARASVSATEDVVVHIHGLPWELEQPEIVAALAPMLPEGCKVVETVLPLDKRARRTGRALLRLRITSDDGTAVTSGVNYGQMIAGELHKQYVGDRWLEARASDPAELAFQRRQIAAITSRTEELAPQAYCRPTASIVRPPSDPRDIVVVCHVPPRVAAGSFDLNNLPDGRVDVLARCASAALFVSFGVRKATTLWLVLSGSGVTLCCHGRVAKGLHPDERTIGSAIRRTLLSASAGGRGMAPDGWTAVQDDRLEHLLPRLLTAKVRDEAGEHRLEAGEAELESGEAELEAGEQLSGGARLVVLHEQGMPLSESLLMRTAQQETVHESERTDQCGTVFVLGGHQGFSREEEAAIDECLERFDGVRASVGHVPLLASHCIVLAHAVLDSLSHKRGG